MSTNVTPPASPVRVAAVQMNPSTGLENRDKNINLTLRAIHDAADQGAQLVVLPEYCSTSYGFANRADAFDHAEDLLPSPDRHTWSLASL